MVKELDACGGKCHCLFFDEMTHDIPLSCVDEYILHPLWCLAEKVGFDFQGEGGKIKMPEIVFQKPPRGWSLKI